MRINTHALTSHRVCDVSRLMYADRADSPLLGICFKPDRLPCLVLQKCLVYSHASCRVVWMALGQLSHSSLCLVSNDTAVISNTREDAAA
jgi:hypothetical protein